MKKVNSEKWAHEWQSQIPHSRFLTIPYWLKKEKMRVKGSIQKLSPKAQMGGVVVISKESFVTISSRWHLREQRCRKNIQGHQSEFLKYSSSFLQRLASPGYKYCICYFLWALSRVFQAYGILAPSTLPSLSLRALFHECCSEPLFIAPWPELLWYLSLKYTWTCPCSVHTEEGPCSTVDPCAKAK